MLCDALSIRLNLLAEAISEEGRQAAVDPHTETVGD
jgi:hypothetical protein